MSSDGQPSDDYNLHLLFAIGRQADQTRRWLGQKLDKAGLGPKGMPFRPLFREPGVILRDYNHNKRKPAQGPILLIVPAPIKDMSIWDLLPSVSVIRHCLRSGLRVYLLDWTPPERETQGFGLAEYADRLILNCLDVLHTETGHAQVLLATHSLGGTLAAIFASLHPERLKGLVLLSAPLHFGRNTGAISTLMAASSSLSCWRKPPDNVPGSLLTGGAWLSAPLALGWARWQDWLTSLGDRRAMQTHLRVERWSYAERPLAQRLFQEIQHDLYRENRFMCGNLQVGRHNPRPERVSTPLLSVVNTHCPLVPPHAVLPFHQAVSSSDTQVLRYRNQKGVSLQHVGALVGHQAHRQLWPIIIRWLYAHWNEKSHI